MERSLRRCLLAVGLGTAVGLDQDQLQTTYYASLLQYVGCTAEAHEIAAVWSDEIAAGEWFAEIASGQPSEAIAAILRLHGAGEPALRRARMLATALARMPGQNRILEAHCDVGERLAERMGPGPRRPARPHSGLRAMGRKRSPETIEGGGGRAARPNTEARAVSTYPKNRPDSRCFREASGRNLRL